MDLISFRDRQLKEPKSSQQLQDSAVADRDAASESLTTGSKRRGAFDVKWDGMLSRLVRYKNRFGDCLVPNRYNEDPALGAWVSTQRRQYKILMSGEATSTPMTLERLARLEEIGFQWTTQDPRHVKWEDRYEQLVEFKKKYGNCIVPIRYRGNPQLSNWVSTQRQEYGLFMEHRPSRMTPQKIHLLNLIGFTWKAERGGGGRAKLRKIAEEAGLPFPATNKTPRRPNRLGESVNNRQLPPRQVLLSAAAKQQPSMAEVSRSTETVPNPGPGHHQYSQPSSIPEDAHSKLLSGAAVSHFDGAAYYSVTNRFKGPSLAQQGGVVAAGSVPAAHNCPTAMPEFTGASSAASVPFGGLPMQAPAMQQQPMNLVPALVYFQKPLLSSSQHQNHLFYHHYIHHYLQDNNQQAYYSDPTAGLPFNLSAPASKETPQTHLPMSQLSPFSSASYFKSQGGVATQQQTTALSGMGQEECHGYKSLFLPPCNDRFAQTEAKDANSHKTLSKSEIRPSLPRTAKDWTSDSTDKPNFEPNKQPRVAKKTAISSKRSSIPVDGVVGNLGGIFDDAEEDHNHVGL